MKKERHCRGKDNAEGKHTIGSKHKTGSKRHNKQPTPSNRNAAKHDVSRATAAPTPHRRTIAALVLGVCHQEVMRVSAALVVPQTTVVQHNAVFVVVVVGLADSPKVARNQLARERPVDPTEGALDDVVGPANPGVAHAHGVEDEVAVLGGDGGNVSASAQVGEGRGDKDGISEVFVVGDDEVVDIIQHGSEGC
jgi:hypothetical protein